MATTVTYKNNTLVTVSNQTKTLKTAGKYLEDDITLVDVTSTGITPTGNINITQAGVTDVTNYATATVPSASYNLEIYGQYITESGVQKYKQYAELCVDPGEGAFNAGWLAQGRYFSDEIIRNMVPANTTVTPSTSAQTVGGANYIMDGPVTVAAMPSGTTTAPTSISGTSATVSTGTNTLTLTKTVSVTPRVTTAGYVSAGTAGNSSVSLTASVTTRAAGTITPTKSTQTIPSGTYLTGTQTIAAIPAAYQDVTSVTATASDVISGKDIVNSSGTVVHGSLVVQNYYTGSTEPSSSLGSNGDLYFQTE